MGVFDLLDSAVNNVTEAKADILNALAQKGCAVDGNEGFSEIPQFITDLPTQSNNVEKGSFTLESDVSQISLAYDLPQAPNYLAIYCNAPVKAASHIGISKNEGWLTLAYNHSIGSVDGECKPMSSLYGFKNITASGATLVAEDGYLFRAKHLNGNKVTYNWTAAVH